MRSLSFEREKKDRFDICLGAMLLPGKGYAGDRRKTAKRVIKKLKEMADKVDQGGQALYEIKPEGGEVFLEEAEFSLLKSTVDEMPWTGEAIEKADECIEWLESLKEVKPKVDDTPAS